MECGQAAASAPHDPTWALATFTVHQPYPTPAPVRIEYFNDDDDDTVLQFRWKSDEKGIKEKTVVTGALLKTSNPNPVPVVSCKGTPLQAVCACRSCGGVCRWRRCKL